MGLGQGGEFHNEFSAGHIPIRDHEVDHHFLPGLLAVGRGPDGMVGCWRCQPRQRIPRLPSGEVVGVVEGFDGPVGQLEGGEVRCFDTGGRGRLGGVSGVRQGGPW